MSEAKHTPGPWEVKPPSWRRHGPPYKTAIVSASGVVANALTHAPAIRFVGNAADGTLREISIPPCPDAHLIAAAPDLLAALKEMCRIIAFASPETLEVAIKRCYDDARAAIDKAEGQ